MKRWADWLIATAIFGVCLGMYEATLSPSLSYVSPDGNELATIPYILGLAHPTGYPLYTWLGKLFTFIPVGDVAHRMNLMSATLGAGGVAFLYLTILAITRSRVASAFAALFFAFSATFWSQTGIAEVYAPNIFMLSLTLFFLIRWARETEKTQPWESSLAATLYFFAFCLVFALSLGTHMSNLALAPALALFILLVNWRILAQPLVLAGGFSLFVLGCLQFLWLPLRAVSLQHGLAGPNAPATLAGFLNYTVNAFPQFKFAFPLSAIPERIGIYLELLQHNFDILGMLLALAGMWSMLFKQTRVFFLLVVMYLAEVVFFVQYRAFDIEVFFLPAHFIISIFIGFGVYQLMHYISLLIARTRVPQRIGSGGLALALMIPLLFQVAGSYAENDYSQNTVINDFYENVFAYLPQNSVLLGRSGVFGYDMFYFRYVYDIRPDVLMPAAEPGLRSLTQELAERATYTTEQPRGQRRGPQAMLPELLDERAWYVPVLAAPTERGPGWQGRGLTLYQVMTMPPSIVATEVKPHRVVHARLGALELVGYDLESTEVRRGGTIHIVYYWRVLQPGSFIVATVVGDSRFEEVHEVGFGNLNRYMQEFRPPRDAVIVEKYDLVIPSSTEPGEHTLQVGLARPGPADEQGYAELEKITVTIGERL